MGNFFQVFVENKMYKVNMTGFMKTVSKNSCPALAFFFSPKSTIKKFKGISGCFSSARLSFGHVMIQLVGYNLTVLFVHSSIQSVACGKLHNCNFAKE